MLKKEWDLTPLLKNDKDPKAEKNLKEVAEKSYEFINKWKDRKDYLSEPKVLREALDEYEYWARNFSTDGDVGYYFWLRLQTEQTNSKVRAKFNKLYEQSMQIINAMEFFMHNISKIDQKTQSKMLQSGELAPYKHLLENSFESAKHLLSEKEEKIMNLKSKTAHSNWANLTSKLLSKEVRTVVDEKGKKTKKTFAELTPLMSDKNEHVRKSAAKAFNSVLKKHLDTAEAEMNSIMENKKINDELRKFESPEHARFISDDLEPKVVEVLIDTIKKDYELVHKYYGLKASLLGLDKLPYHERYIEYGKMDQKFEYEEAVKLVKETFAELDPEFEKIFDDMINNGRIDVYPKKGKSDGAFCVHNLISQPVYIFLNYTNKMRDVLTIAHESGHAINNYLMAKEQNALNFCTPLSTAEVASTFMEDFVTQNLLKNADDNLKLALLMHKMEDSIGTVYSQAAMFSFEKELHESFREKGYLAHKEIGDIYEKHVMESVGPSVYFTKGSENRWVGIGHFRRFFYNYQYASGLLISKGLQSLVKKRKNNVDKVKKFLSAGSSESPKNILSSIGIDITKKEFWAEGLGEINNTFEEINTLAKKLGKLS